MTTGIVDESTPEKPLRLWPGVIAASLLLLSWFGLPLVIPDGLLYGLIGAAVGALAIVVWWLFFSRAAWSERLGAIVLMVVALLVTKPLLHESIAGAGMGKMIYILAIPVMTVALVAWAVVTRRASSGLRRASMAGSILLACGVFTLLRTGGISGEGDSDFHWRWTPTPEQRLLAQAGNEEEPVVPPLTAAAAPAETSSPTPAVGPPTSPIPAS